MLTEGQWFTILLVVIFCAAMITFMITEAIDRHAAYFKRIAESLESIDRRDQKYRDEYEEEKNVEHGFTTYEIR